MRGHLVIALVLSGCSWMHVEKPSAKRPLTCDPDSNWPLVDASIAIGSYTGMLGGLTWLAYADPESKKVGFTAGISMLALGVTGWIWSASFHSGQMRTYECAALHRQAP